MYQKAGGGLGFFQVFMAVASYGNARMQALKAANRQGFYAEYEFRLSELDRIRAEAQASLATAEGKTITAQNEALKKIQAADAEQDALLKAIQFKSAANIFLIGSGVVSAVVLVAYLVKDKGGK
jgi:hypothetical protein